MTEGGEGDESQGGPDQGNKPVRQNYYRGFRPRFRPRGPPRPRPVRDGEEDKENQGGEGGQNQQPRQRRYRRNFNYRRRRQQTGGKPGQENKEAKTGGDPSAEKTSAPEAQQALHHNALVLHGRLHHHKVIKQLILVGGVQSALTDL
ncbi:hypothetical protein INR49_022359, partial [Caranx melampygus]